MLLVFEMGVGVGLIWWFVCCVDLGCFVYCDLVLSGCILVFSCVCFGVCGWFVGWVLGICSEWVVWLGWCWCYCCFGIAVVSGLVGY